MPRMVAFAPVSLSGPGTRLDNDHRIEGTFLTPKPHSQHRTGHVKGGCFLPKLRREMRTPLTGSVSRRAAMFASVRGRGRDRAHSHWEGKGKLSLFANILQTGNPRNPFLKLKLILNY